MNKFIIAIVSTLIMTVTGASFAQDAVIEPEKKKQRQHRQQQQRGMQAMPAVEMTMRAIRRLDLSPEQKEDIRGIIEGLKADARPLMAETRANQEQLKGLVKAINFDEKAVAAIAEKEGDLAAERLMLTSRVLSDVYKVLTREQRGELEDMAAQRQDKRNSMRQRKGKGQDTGEG